jgi:hypothetical protein
MATRVLATEEARAAVTQLQSVLTGGLTNEVTALKNHGDKLADPGVWDGQVANDFRSNVWPNVSKSLSDMLNALEELRSKIDQVTRNIMAAGGNQA